MGGGLLTITAGTGAVRDSVDNSIVTVTTDTAQTQHASYVVVINGVTDLNNNAVAPNTKGYFIGNGPPSVVSAISGSPTSVIVIFSEPLDPDDDAQVTSAGCYYISGLTVSGAAWPSGGAGDRTVVELTTSPQSQQIYTLMLTATAISAADDLADIGAGYNTAGFQGDGLPAVFSALAITSTEVKVIFSEPVDMLTSQNEVNYAMSGSLVVVSAVRNADPYANEVLLTTSAQSYENYTVTVAGVKDTNGNTISGNSTAGFAGIGTD